MPVAARNSGRSGGGGLGAEFALAPADAARRSSSSSSSAAISSRRARTSSSWRSAWWSSDSRIWRRRTGSSTPSCHSRRSAARLSSASTSSFSPSSETPSRSAAASARSAARRRPGRRCGGRRARGRRRRGGGRSPRSSGSSAASCPASLATSPILSRSRGSEPCARSWRRLDLLGDRLLDRHRAGRAGGALRASPRSLARAQHRDAGAEHRDRGEHPERRVHVGDEGVELGAGQARGEAGEDLEEDVLRAPRR